MFTLRFNRDMSTAIVNITAKTMFKADPGVVALVERGNAARFEDAPWQTG